MTVVEASTSTAFEIIAGLINEELEAPLVVPHEAAARIVAQLQREQPKVLIAYLMEHAVKIVGADIRLLLTSRRASAMSQRDRRAFAESVVSNFSGDPTPLRTFLDKPFESPGGNKPLKFMKAEDCDFAAKRYESIAEGNAKRAAFFKAVAKGVGDKTVGDVYTEERIQQVWEQFVGKPC